MDRSDPDVSGPRGSALSALWTYHYAEEVREIYQNIEVQKNEDGIEELGFKDISITEKFIKNMSTLSISYMDSKTK